MYECVCVVCIDVQVAIISTVDYPFTTQLPHYIYIFLSLFLKWFGVEGKLDYSFALLIHSQ